MVQPCGQGAQAIDAVIHAPLRQVLISQGSVLSTSPSTHAGVHDPQHCPSFGGSIFQPGIQGLQAIAVVIHNPSWQCFGSQGLVVSTSSSVHCLHSPQHCPSGAGKAPKGHIGQCIAMVSQFPVTSHSLGEHGLDLSWVPGVHWAASLSFWHLALPYFLHLFFCPTLLTLSPAQTQRGPGKHSTDFFVRHVGSHAETSEDTSS